MIAKEGKFPGAEMQGRCRNDILWLLQPMVRPDHNANLFSVKHMQNQLMHRIKLLQGDITQLRVDAIVNAANERLLGGGGVDGAIHRAAGPELLAYCRTLNGCPTGEAKLTPGFRLPAKYIIHTVGPVYGSMPQEQAAQLLANAYRNSLSLAASQGFKSVAFPNISTGVYGFPKEKAADIAMETVCNFLQQSALPEEVTFVCFDEENYRIYQAKLGQI